MSSTYTSLLLGLLVSLVEIVPLPAEAEEQGERLVYEGAILKSTGESAAADTVDSNLHGVRALRAGRLQSTHLAEGMVLVESAQGAAVASDDSEEMPEVYSGKNDPCRSAKIRRVIREIGGHVTCTPNWALFASATAPVPNDPYYSNLYAAAQMSLPQAWNVTTGADDVVIQVIDTGIRYDHPDLAANMWKNSLEVAGNGIDDDGNGYVDDIYGINAITNSGDPLDDHYHGTHVAGTIGAVGNNGVGVTGVAWKVKLMAGKFLSSTGSGSTSNAIKAIDYGRQMRQRGVKLVASNNSWGGGGFNAALLTSIQAAVDAGVVFVAAAGNAATNTDLTPNYPSCYNSSGIISVASNTSTGELSSFSNYGATSVDISAPGSSIFSTYPVSSYATLSGTSMATPQISGLLALAQSMCGRTLTVSELKNAVLLTGTYVAGLSGKVASSSIANGLGVVNYIASICPQTAVPTNTPLPATPTIAPSATPTPILTPTAAPTSVASPTPTLMPTMTAVPSISPTSAPTIAPTFTMTSAPTQTPTSTPTSTSTPTRTATATASPTYTPTRTPTATFTITPTRTAAPTATPTAKPTLRPTRTPFPTLTPTRTPTPTFTPRATRTPTPTFTPRPTRTPTPTFTPRPTRTPTPTFTPRPTRTPTPTPTPRVSQIVRKPAAAATPRASTRWFEY